jgi:hypothetical protein
MQSKTCNFVKSLVDVVFQSAPISRQFTSRSTTVLLVALNILVLNFVACGPARAQRVTGPGIPIARLFKQDQEHMYSNSTSEIFDRQSKGYTVEAYPYFNLFSNPDSASGFIPLYRCVQGSGSDERHLLTTDPGCESGTGQKQLEGNLGYISTIQDSSTPLSLYRLYCTETRSNFYTTSFEEALASQSNPDFKCKFEFIAGYVSP